MHSQLLHQTEFHLSHLANNVESSCRLTFHMRQFCYIVEAWANYDHHSGICGRISAFIEYDVTSFALNILKHSC